MKTLAALGSVFNCCGLLLLSHSTMMHYARENWLTKNHYDAK